MTDFTEKLKKALGTMQLFPDENTLSRMELFTRRILEKNQVMNLTAITDEDEFIEKHFVDSLSLLTYTEEGKAILSGKKEKMIDIGTGAGFPGLALKICCPQIDMTLNDSLRKRLVFLEEVIRELGLTGVRTLHMRAEDLGRDRKHRGAYPLVLARAVANLSTLSEYALPLVQKNGRFIAYKGDHAAEEIRAAEQAVKKLGGSISEAKEFVLPGTELSRTFVVIRKTGETPAAYPRKAGIPSREPL